MEEDEEEARSLDDQETLEMISEKEREKEAPEMDEDAFSRLATVESVEAEQESSPQS